MSATLTVGPLVVDPADGGAVTLHGEPVVLTRAEFRLLRILVADPTRVFTKDELLRDVWGRAMRGRHRTLDSACARLRHVLGRQGDRFVVNVWGVGYRLTDPPLDR